MDRNGNDVESGIGVLNPFRYRGYFYDSVSGLYFLKTRFYDPEVGRFLTPDSVDYANPKAVNGLNLYAYCGNNPVMNIDPSGHEFLSIFLGALIAGAVFGGAINVYKTYNEGARDWGLVGAFVGGAIMGGAMGAVVAIGGAAGFASLGLPATVVGGSTWAAFGISCGIGIGAGLLSYSAETISRKDKPWNWGVFATNGFLGGVQAAATFGLIIGITIAVIAVCFVGSLVGMIIARELKKAGKLK